MKPFKILIALLFFILIFSCENKTYIEILREEYIPKSVSGTVNDIELWKGSTLSLHLKNNSKEEVFSIHTDHKILMEIKKGDYFKKRANSNKCFIERGDSIIYIDCWEFSDEERDSLGRVEEWKPEEKNHWKLKR